MEDEDLAQCEGCGKRHAWDQTRFTDDGCATCPECQQREDEAFRQCNHEWSLAYDSMGDPGQFCGRCHHIVNNDLFPKLFPDVPLSTAERSFGA